MALFISYRRGVTQDVVGRLRDRLKEHCQVFQDIESIRPGSDFVALTTNALATADAVLVVIGPDWTSAGDLHDERDWVRIEVQKALERPATRVIPILVGGADLPAAEVLPPPLRPLLSRQAVRLDSGADFDAHYARIRAELGLSSKPIVGRVARALAFPALVVLALSVGAAVRGSRPTAATAAPSSDGLPSATRVPAPIPSSREEARPVPSSMPSAQLAVTSPPASQAAAHGLTEWTAHHEPNEADLRSAILTCWKQTEGANPKQAQSSISAVLNRTLNLASVDSRAFASCPRFHRCMNAAQDRIWNAMTPGVPELRVDTLLPGAPPARPFPAESEARAAMLKCWKATEGGLPDAAPTQLSVKVTYGGSQFPTEPRAPKFGDCARPIIHDYSDRASTIDLLSFSMTLPGGAPAAAPAP